MAFLKQLSVLEISFGWFLFSISGQKEMLMQIVILFLALVNKYPYQEKPITSITSGNVELHCGFKIHIALADVALLFGVLSVHHKVAGSICFQGTYPAGSIPWSGYKQKATN